MSLPIEQGGWGMSSGYQSNSSDSSMNDSNGGGGSSGQFRSLVEKIMRRNAKGHKVSLLITSAFSLAAALIVIVVVLSDARALQQRSFSVKKRARPSLWNCVHKAEVMPLAIAVASAVQSCIFLGVQSQALGNIWVSGCTKTAQLVWPTIWVVAFTVTAFSLESTFRSLQSAKFEPRGRLHLFVSVALIKLLILATWITAHVLPSKDICWGSLTWWAIHFIQPSIALAAGVILVNLVTGVVLVIQLLKTVEMCRDERIAASRVIYSLCINIILLTLTLPWFISFSLGNLNKDTSLMADSVVTLNGLLHGVVHLFLRTNSEPLAIRPKDTPWTKGRPLRLFGPNDLNIHDFISTPIVSNREVERTMLYTGKEKRVPFDSEHGMLPRQQFISIHPDVPPPPFPSESKRPMVPAPSYTLFPSDKIRNEHVASTGAMIPANLLITSDIKAKSPPLIDSVLAAAPRDEDDDDLETVLQPPQPLFFGHQRSQSDTTSAIVEIALRLSSAPSDADSVYISEPIQPTEPVKLARGPSLLSPDKYVHSARLAEAARSRPITPKEPHQEEHQHQNIDLVEIHKPVDAPKLIGLSKNPVDNKKKLQQSIRESIAARISNQRPNPEPSINKRLPPVPDKEQPQELAALEALVKSSYPLIAASAKPTLLPKQDWRKVTPNSKPAAGAAKVKSDASRPANEGVTQDSWL